MWFSDFCMTFILKPTKRSKYVYFLLVCNESRMALIEYTKTVNSTASLVVAISSIKYSEIFYEQHELLNSNIASIY